MPKNGPSTGRPPSLPACRKSRACHAAQRSERCRVQETEEEGVRSIRGGDGTPRRREDAGAADPENQRHDRVLRLGGQDCRIQTFPAHVADDQSGADRSRSGCRSRRRIIPEERDDSCARPHSPAGTLPREVAAFWKRRAICFSR